MLPGARREDVAEWNRSISDGIGKEIALAKAQPYVTCLGRDPPYATWLAANLTIKWLAIRGARVVPGVRREDDAEWNRSISDVIGKGRIGKSATLRGVFGKGPAKRNMARRQLND